MLKDPDNDHHAHEQKDHVHINGMNGALIGEDMIFRIKCSQGVADHQHDRRAKHGCQGPMQKLKGNQHVGQDKNNRGNPECRSLAPRDLNVDMDIGPCWSMCDISRCNLYFCFFITGFISIDFYGFILKRSLRHLKDHLKSAVGFRTDAASPMAMADGRRFQFLAA